MKSSEVHVGKTYYANVSGKRVRLLLQSVKKTDGVFIQGKRASKAQTHYICRNLETNRIITVKSPMKFLQEYRPLTKKSETKVVAPKKVRLSSNSPNAQNVLRESAATMIESGFKDSATGEPQTYKAVVETPPDSWKDNIAPVVPRPEKPMTYRELEDKNAAHLTTSPPEKESALAGLVAESKVEKRKSVGQHTIVKAYAGTGKTFTQIVGVAWAYGNARVWQALENRLGFTPTPSEEQQKVWDKMKALEGIQSVTYCAFNKSIVTEFQEKWSWLVGLMADCGVALQFATVNSLGNKDCSKAYGFCKVSDHHTENLVCDVLGRDPRELRRDERSRTMVDAAKKLVSMCKLTLTGWTREQGLKVESITQDDLDYLCKQYDIETNGSRYDVYDLVPKVLRRSLDVSYTRAMDFNDQNWLPVVNRLPIPRVDLLMIDEGQDLPRCKQEYGIQAGKNVMLVGDVNQAIYGFAGADVDSIPRMQELLQVAEPLSLTETRRCGKAIVAEAQRIVPDFKAHESNPLGEIRHIMVEKLVDEAKDADMVLCRTNAPLVSQALKLLKEGKKAIIRGRDFGGQLMKFIKKLDADSVEDLMEKSDAFVRQEVARENNARNPNENKIISMQDRHDCIMSFCSGAKDLTEVNQRINTVFAGKVCPNCNRNSEETYTECYGCKVPLVTPKGVLFSSIHRAKGLEADRVFILKGKGAELPHPMAKTPSAKGQERNLEYVAITRAINVLTWVTIPKEAKPAEEEV